MLQEEFLDIWNRAPKFPDADENNSARVDVDSFVQIYRDIDDLFEDDSDTTGGASAKKTTESTSIQEEDNQSDPRLEAELETIFDSLSDSAGLLSKEDLRQWEEISKLVEDGLLGEEEFDDLWDQTKKSRLDNSLDVEGFLSFNVALDDLFDFDDDEMDEVDVPMEAYSMDEEETAPEPKAPALRMVDSTDMTPEELFIALADENSLVGRAELKFWSELQEMLKDGELLDSELTDLFGKTPKSEMDLSKLEQEGFMQLYQAIDDLFETDDDDEETESKSPPESASSAKDDLLEAIASLDIEGLLPCGMEALESEQKDILGIAEAVEKESSNLIRQKQGNLDPEDLDGDWELLYTSSSAFKFNQGLSGLGGSVPNGKFGNLVQKLKANKFLADVEYVEHIALNPDSASFDVSVTGTWDLRTSVSLFTGEPSIVMTVTPDRVTYGPTSTRADHWKSLGPMNMLDISYVDNDLRIMRGNTSVDTIFVWRRK